MENDAADVDEVSSKPVAWSRFESDYSLGDLVTGV